MINTKHKVRYFFLAVFMIGLSAFWRSEALALANFSDRLSLSWPGVPSDHTLTFKLVKDVPPGGKIAVVPESGRYAIPPSFDAGDVDISVSDSLNGFYAEREVSSSPVPGSDTVTVTASGTDGSIDITLDSLQGIAAGSYVKLELGANAQYGASGTNQILNPVDAGSYSVDAYTYDSEGNYLERGMTLAAILEPVRAGNYVLKSRSNGTPAGVLNYGTTQALLSLMSNYPAFCRWSLIASTSYNDMTNTFSNSGGYYHSTVITVASGKSFHYYVRCKDTRDNAVDMQDYEIYFVIAGYEGQGGNQDVKGTPGNDKSGPGSGGGTGGGTGNVSGGASGTSEPYPPLPGPPAISFQGYAYPLSKVVLLRDGTESQNVSAANNGSFTMDVSGLVQGTYTFSFTSSDKAGRQPAAQSYTFYVKDGTKTQINDVFLPPTIEISNNSLKAGDSLRVLGVSAAAADIELWVYPKLAGQVPEASIAKYKGKSGANGEWNFDIDTGKMENGLYQVKAKSSLASHGQSEFSKTLEIMMGGEMPKQSTCGGADLNGDGKVNITDFSILLYWWNKSNDCADQNHDGTVNLTDFSIMMYNWTG